MQIAATLVKGKARIKFDAPKVGRWAVSSSNTTAVILPIGTACNRNLIFLILGFCIVSWLIDFLDVICIVFRFMFSNGGLPYDAGMWIWISFNLDSGPAF
jgi:hypothetical protein